MNMVANIPQESDQDKIEKQNPEKKIFAFRNVYKQTNTHTHTVHVINFQVEPSRLLYELLMATKQTYR